MYFRRHMPCLAYKFCKNGHVCTSVRAHTSVVRACLCSLVRACMTGCVAVYSSTVSLSNHKRTSDFWGVHFFHSLLRFKAYPRKPLGFFFPEGHKMRVRRQSSEHVCGTGLFHTCTKKEYMYYYYVALVYNVHAQRCSTGF